MASRPLMERVAAERWTDEQAVERVLAGDSSAFEIIMRRYNQRLYRVARSILRDDGEAEDVMQDAYVRAYQHLDQFEGRAKFSTWLTRIAVHEALARAQRRSRIESLDAITGPNGEVNMPDTLTRSPEAQASGREVSRLLEEAMLSLPDGYRTVIMLRDVEEMDTAEAAEVLDITEENVKVRLHRARTMLRRELYSRAGATSSASFQFPATRCDRVVKAVFERIARL